MIVILAKFTVEEAGLDRAKALARTLAAETNKEPGCLQYAVASDLSDACTLRLSEWWRDAEALAAHFATAHMAAFRRGLRGMHVAGVEIKRFEVSAAGDIDPGNPQSA